MRGKCGQYYLRDTLPDGRVIQGPYDISRFRETDLLSSSLDTYTSQAEMAEQFSMSYNSLNGGLGWASKL